MTGLRRDQERKGASLAFATVVHSEGRQAEGNAEPPGPQEEPSTEGIIVLEREDYPHDTANKQYS